MKLSLTSKTKALSFLFATIAAVGSIAALAAEPTANSERRHWTQYRYNPSHSGVNPNETILSPATVGNLTVKWRTTIGAGFLASASVTDRRVYVASSGTSKLYALDKAAGQELWNFPADALAGDFSDTTPAIANGIVYYGVNRFDPVVFAVNAATGTEVWRHVGPLAQIVSSPTVIGGRVYVAFTDGTIRALEATTGNTIWSVIHPGGSYSSPAVADGRFYIAIHNSGLLALNARTGATLWLANMPGPQWSSPAVDNGRVFVGSRDDHKVYAFDAVTGETLWTATTSDWVHSSPAVADGVLYIGNEAGDLYAFNTEDGSRIWRTSLAPGHGIFNGPAVANGVVYAASGLGEGKLYAVNAATGEVLFSDFVGDGDQSGDGEWVTASPIVDRGIVYIPSYESEGDAVVTAFGLED